MRFRYSLTKKDAQEIINCLDLYSRIWIGQYDHLLWDMRWIVNCEELDKCNEELEKKLLRLRMITLPELGYSLSRSYGIFSDTIDKRSNVAYNMQQEFRYRLAWFENPEGGYTVDFSRPMPTKADTNPWPEASCRKVNDETIEDIEINENQRQIIIDAIKIRSNLEDRNIVDLFRFYTNSSEALSIASEIETILKSIEADKYYKKFDFERLLYALH